MKLSGYQILLLLFRLIFILVTMYGLYAFAMVSLMGDTVPEIFLKRYQLDNVGITTSELKILASVIFITVMGLWYRFGILIEHRLKVYLLPNWITLYRFYHVRPRPNLLKLLARRQKQSKQGIEHELSGPTVPKK